MSVKSLRNTLEQRKGKRQQIEESLGQTKQRLQDYKNKLKVHEQAREVIRQVGIETQRELQYHISDITTLALDAVFDDPYKLVVEFVERRNKTECDISFQRNEDRIDPIDASGGGAVDVAAFALRVASWSMQSPRTRPVIILDEPMKFLSRDLQPRASEMIKELSDRMGIQFIIVTHDANLTESADKVFTTKMKKGVTEVS